jgi:curved DNA-binding protein CbpA
MSTDLPDPYAVLGVESGASGAEITAAYKRAVRACHPDTAHPDRDRLAAVIAAYRRLRDQPRDQRRDQLRDQLHDRDVPPRPSRGTEVPVRVHPRRPASPDPDLWAGPVRRHPSERRTT